MQKLAALRLLDEGMIAIEAQRQAAIEGGEKASQVDREAAQYALQGVVRLFMEQGIEAQPLVRLLSELVALSAGSKPSPMLAPARTHHRSPDAPIRELVKGRLAAVMEFRQKAGSTRKAAREWVVRNMPPETTRQFSVTAATVDSWLVKWGGERGATRRGLGARAIGPCAPFWKAADRPSGS